MILAKLAAAALFVGVAAGPLDDPQRAALHRLPPQQKSAGLEPYLRSATECIALAVAAERRARKDDSPADLGDLIVAAVPKCLGPVHALIDAHDRYYGDGTGDVFFMGPYLDFLPGAVVKLTADTARSPR